MTTAIGSFVGAVTGALSSAAIDVTDALGDIADDLIGGLAFSTDSGGGTFRGGGAGRGGSGASGLPYSREVPDGWQKVYETKSINEIAKDNNWSLDKMTMNSSHERKIIIRDSDGKAIGEVHLGHKVKINGKSTVVQDHYHIYSDSQNIHYVLPNR